MFFLGVSLRKQAEDGMEELQALRDSALPLSGRVWSLLMWPSDSTGSEMGTEVNPGRGCLGVMPRAS